MSIRFQIFSMDKNSKYYKKTKDVALNRGLDREPFLDPINSKDYSNPAYGRSRGILEPIEVYSFISSQR